MFSLQKLSWIALSLALYLPLNITLSEWLRRFQPMWIDTLTLGFPWSDILSTCYHVKYRSSGARGLFWQSKGLCIEISLVVLFLLYSLLWISWGWGFWLFLLCLSVFLYLICFRCTMEKWEKIMLHRHIVGPRLNLVIIIF